MPDGLGSGFSALDSLGQAHALAKLAGLAIDIRSLKAGIGWPCQALIVQQIRRNFADKATGLIVTSPPIEEAGIGIGQIKGLLSPCDAHIGQTALLFQVTLIICCPNKGEDIFFHPNQKNHWKFQALGCMEGHEGHFCCLAITIIRIRNQGQVIEEAAQFLQTSLLFLDFFFIKALGHREEFLDIFNTGIGFQSCLNG